MRPRFFGNDIRAEGWAAFQREYRLKTTLRRQSVLRLRNSFRKFIALQHIAA
jgi:hypothetical protein